MKTENQKTDDRVTLDPTVCAQAAEECVCQSFRRASRVVTQMFDEALAPCGLRSTQLIMLVTLGANEMVTPTALARQLGMDSSTANRTLSTLEGLGLVAKHRDGGRSHYTLSVAGKRAVLDAMPHWRAAQERFIVMFGAEEWSKLQPQLNSVAP